MSTTDLTVLFDLSVILDVLQQRKPFYADSARAWAVAEQGWIKGLIAAHSVTTLYYLSMKDKSGAQARVILTEILQTLKVATVDHNTIEQALNLPYRDFEDAVQMMAAIHAGAQYIITRNTQDYTYGPLPVLTPVELLSIL